MSTSLERTEGHEVERTRNRRALTPRADIYESQDELVLKLDMPGVREDGIDVRLERNVLSIEGRVEPVQRTGYELRHQEWSSGDWTRSFRLSSEVARDKISAKLTDGVLTLVLPKVEAARPRKIEVTAG